MLFVFIETSVKFEEAARTVADELTAPRPEGEEEMKDIQVRSFFTH